MTSYVPLNFKRVHCIDDGFLMTSKDHAHCNLCRKDSEQEVVKQCLLIEYIFLL